MIILVSNEVTLKSFDFLSVILFVYSFRQLYNEIGLSTEPAGYDTTCPFFVILNIREM